MRLKICIDLTTVNKNFKLLNNPVFEKPWKTSEKRDCIKFVNSREKAPNYVTSLMRIFKLTIKIKLYTCRCCIIPGNIP